MEVLVTGGFGFIGSHLVEALLCEPETRVHVVDDLSSSPLPLEWLLHEMGPQPRLTYSIATVRDYMTGEGAGRRFDEMFHLASVVGPAGVLQHSGRIVQRIVEDTYLLMDAALAGGVRLLDISTSEIYGGGQQGLCSELMPKIIHPTVSPRLEYAVGKLAAEVALLNSARSRGLNVVIVRPFNVSGPRQSGMGGFVLPRFISLAMRGEDLTVFGTGRQVRAFTNVADIVQGILLAMRKGKAGEAYNVGNPEGRCSINELADDVIRISESASKKVYLDGKVLYGPLYEEANDKFPDARKMMEELGWRPKHTREETIRQTVAYMRSLPDEIRERLSGAAAIGKGF